MRRYSFVAVPLALGLAACAGQISDRGDLFAAYQARMQAEGYLRTDREPADATYTNRQLAEDFRRIAFFTFPNDQFRVQKPLTRWEQPVRYAVVGTDSDRAQVDRLMTRIAGLTGLDIAGAPESASNFIVMLLSEEERRAMRRLAPDMRSRQFFDTLFSSIFDCGALADWSMKDPEIRQVLVYLHDDLDGLYRRLCLQEEISQSFGLFNDDPSVRPSIFNDDDEFALLTRHDEYLLRILYDPRLNPGMSADEAMPIVRRIIDEIRPRG